MLNTKIHSVKLVKYFNYLFSKEMANIKCKLKFTVCQKQMSIFINFFQ